MIFIGDSFGHPFVPWRAEHQSRPGGRGRRRGRSLGGDPRHQQDGDRHYRRRRGHTHPDLSICFNPGESGGGKETNGIDAATNGRGGKGCPVFFATGNSATIWSKANFSAGFRHLKDISDTAGEDLVKIDNVVRVDGDRWTPVGAFSGTGAPVTLVDPDAEANPHRFYRVLQQALEIRQIPLGDAKPIQ